MHGEGPGPLQIYPPGNVRWGVGSGQTAPADVRTIAPPAKGAASTAIVGRSIHEITGASVARRDQAVHASGKQETMVSQMRTSTSDGATIVMVDGADTPMATRSSQSAQRNATAAALATMADINRRLDAIGTPAVTVDVDGIKMDVVGGDGEQAPMAGAAVLQRYGTYQTLEPTSKATSGTGQGQHQRQGQQQQQQQQQCQTGNEARLSGAPAYDDREPWVAPSEWWNTGVRCVFDWLRDAFIATVDREVGVILTHHGVARFYAWPSTGACATGTRGATAGATSAASLLTLMLRPWTPSDRAAHTERGAGGGPNGIAERQRECECDVLALTTSAESVVARVEAGASALGERHAALSEAVRGCAACLRTLLTLAENEVQIVRNHGAATREAAVIATRASAIAQKWVYARTLERVTDASKRYRAMARQVRGEFRTADRAVRAQRGRFLTLWRDLKTRYDAFLATIGLAAVDPAAVQAMDALFWRRANGGPPSSDPPGPRASSAEWRGSSPTEGAETQRLVYDDEEEQEDDEEDVLFDADALRLLRYYCQHMMDVAKGMLERGSQAPRPSSCLVGGTRVPVYDGAGDRERIRDGGSVSSPMADTLTDAQQRRAATDVAGGDERARILSEMRRAREQCRALIGSLEARRQDRARHVETIQRRMDRRAKQLVPPCGADNVTERVPVLSPSMITDPTASIDLAGSQTSRSIKQQDMAALFLCFDDNASNDNNDDDDDDDGDDRSQIDPKNITKRADGIEDRTDTKHDPWMPYLTGGPAPAQSVGANCMQRAFLNGPRTRETSGEAEHPAADGTKDVAWARMLAQLDSAKAADAGDLATIEAARKKHADIDTVLVRMTAHTIETGPHAEWMRAIERLSEVLDDAQKAWRKAHQARTARETILEEETARCLDGIAETARAAHESDVGVVLSQWNDQQHAIDRRRAEDLRQVALARRVVDEWLNNFERKMVYYQEDRTCANAVDAVAEFRAVMRLHATACDAAVRMREFVDAFEDVSYAWSLAYRVEYGDSSERARGLTSTSIPSFSSSSSSSAPRESDAPTEEGACGSLPLSSTLFASTGFLPPATQLIA